MNLEYTRNFRMAVEGVKFRSPVWDANGAINADPEPEITPCQKMWRRVIIQAFIDASYQDPNPREIIQWSSRNRRRFESRIICARARQWLWGDTADFYEVCWMAGIDPDFVKRRARYFERNGWPEISLESLLREDTNCNAAA